uniref:Uncharacterized protein n=1 Tax=Romanomermis culicivorax TaxID=13658 RepID=A0A915JTW8_ROMCU
MFILAYFTNRLQYPTEIYTRNQMYRILDEGHRRTAFIMKSETRKSGEYGKNVPQFAFVYVWSQIGDE